MSSPPWWRGLAPVEAPVPDVAEHRLVWRDGELHLLAHPDPDAEVALAALGGERCPCLDLLAAWDEHHTTGSILVLGARHDAEVLTSPAASAEALAADLARWRGALASLLADARKAQDGDVLDRLGAYRPPEVAAAQRRLDGLLMLGLDRRLQRRLQASVAAALALSSSTSVGAAAMLTAATASRALPALRGAGWTGSLGAITLGPTPGVSADRAVLPPHWTAAVWGRGVAGAVPGHVVVDVTSVTPEGAITVLAQAPGKPQVEIRVDEWETV